MARTKNVGGGLGDDDRRPPPRLPAEAKAKATKKLTTRKHKYPDAETARVAVVAEATERAEAGGAHSGVVIADPPVSSDARTVTARVQRLLGSPPGTVTVEGGQYSIDEGQSQGTSQQQPAQETQQTQQAEEAAEVEETEQAPQP